MIRYVLHSDIDREKYNACVLSSAHSRVYALDWHLDAVTDTWDVLILDDYQAVMPLPKRKKYGLHYIYQPAWVQQLGIFTNALVDEGLVRSFLKKIPLKFVLVDYLFHSGTSVPDHNFLERKNYILKLDKCFHDIQKGFNSNRRRILAKGFEDFSVESAQDAQDLLQLYRNTHTYRGHSDSDEKLQKLIATGYLRIWKVFDKTNLIGGLLWLKDEKRITYLLPVATEKAKKENIPTFLISELMKRYENSGLIFDFEGSMIAGVERFYQSFGAEKEIYFQYLKKGFFK